MVRLLTTHAASTKLCCLGVMHVVQVVARPSGQEGRPRMVGPVRFRQHLCPTVGMFTGELTAVVFTVAAPWVAWIVFAHSCSTPRCVRTGVNANCAAQVEMPKHNSLLAQLSSWL